MPRAKPLVPWDPGHFSFRLTTAQREKIKRCGGAQWLREMIDAAEEPAPEPVKRAPALHRHTGEQNTWFGVLSSRQASA